MGSPGPTATLAGQLTFTNTAATACALVGYPTIQFMKKDGTEVGAPSGHGADVLGVTAKGVEPVIVRPGRHAYVQFRYLDAAALRRSDPPICRATTVTRMRIDLSTEYASTQRGVMTLHTPALTMCKPSASAEQVTNSVVVDYSTKTTA